MNTLQVTAKEEFEKNPELTKEDLKKLRSWLETQKHLPFISEEQLILFLHSCYYNVARTKDCIEAYYKIRSSCLDIFSHREIQRPEVQKIISVMNYAELPVKDQNGCHIIYHSINDKDPSKYDFPVAVRIFIMMIESCLVYEGTSPGIVFLLDATGLKFGHVMRLSISLLRKLFQYLQEGMPIRLKAIHVVNVIPIVDQIMVLVKPFMNKELFDMIHFHKGNNETLYKYLPRKCLPREYGGELPSVAELHARYIPRLRNLEPYFKEEEKFRNADSKMHERRTRSDPPESAMRSLSID